MSSRTNTEPQTVKRIQAYALATECGLTRQDRIDLAEMLLKRDCVSWKSLSENEIGRLVDAMQGFAYVHFLLTQRQV